MKRKHQVVNGSCTVCRRTGGDLSQSCPGYVTAGEMVKEWPSRKAAPTKKRK